MQLLYSHRQIESRERAGVREWRGLWGSVMAGAVAPAAACCLCLCSQTVVALRWMSSGEITQSLLGRRENLYSDAMKSRNKAEVRTERLQTVMYVSRKGWG